MNFLSTLHHSVVPSNEGLYACLKPGRCVQLSRLCLVLNAPFLLGLLGRGTRAYGRQRWDTLAVSSGRDDGRRCLQFRCRVRLRSDSNCALCSVLRQNVCVGSPVFLFSLAGNSSCERAFVYMSLCAMFVQTFSEVFTLAPPTAVDAIVVMVRAKVKDASEYACNREAISLGRHP